MRDLCSTVFSQANDHAVAIKPRRCIDVRCDYRHAIFQASDSNVLLPWSDSRLHYSRRAEYQFDVVADQYSDLVPLQLEDRVRTSRLRVLSFKTEQVDLELSPNNLPVVPNSRTAKPHVSLDLFIKGSPNNCNSVLLSQRLQAWQRTHRRRNHLLRQPMFWQTNDVYFSLCGFLRELYRVKDRILYRCFDWFDLHCCGSDDLLRH